MRIELSAIRAIAEIEDRNNKVYEAAKYYASQGIPVIPLPVGKKFTNDKSIYTSKCSAKPATIDKWFHPTTGDYKGWNIALGCGDYYEQGGIFAVDIDTKYVDKYGDEKWGHAAWKELTDKHGDVYGPVAKTPSGGSHVITLWQENLTPSQNKIGLAIDTRGGSRGKISSHIVVFPSIVEGQEYEWVMGGKISSAPQWICGMMGMSWGSASMAGVAKTVGPMGSSRGNEEMEDGDIEDFVQLDKVQSILGTVNPNDLTYEEWLRIGQAIHSQHPNDEGLSVWDEWSQQGERYELDECAIRWRGFKHNGPIRMATLMYIAQNRGAAASLVSGDVEADEGMLVDIIDEYNRLYAMVLSGDRAKILRKTVHPDYGQTIYPSYRTDAMRQFLGNDTILVMDAKGTPKPKSKYDIWMASTRRRTFHGTLMVPDGDRVLRVGSDLILNTWAGFSIEPRPGDWGLLKAHMLTTLCGGNQSHYEWMMDWIADLLQDPANPKGCAIVLGGIEGAGKGTLANCLVRILGIHAAVVSNAKHLNSQYNALLTDSVLLFADEVVFAGNHEAANQMKAMITERTLVREAKFGDQGIVKNHLHVIMSTNNDWKIAAGPESRRYFVLQVESEVANDVKYFAAIKHQMDNGGYEAMLDELLSREITSNLRYAPVTAELKRQRTLMSVHSVGESFPAWVAYAVDLGVLGVHDMNADMNNEAQGWPTLINKADIYNAYMKWARENRPKSNPMSTSMFFPALTKMGFTEGPRKSSSEGRVRTIAAPEYAAFCASAETIYAIPNPNTTQDDEDDE